MHSCEPVKHFDYRNLRLVALDRSLAGRVRRAGTESLIALLQHVAQLSRLCLQNNGATRFTMSCHCVRRQTLQQGTAAGTSQLLAVHAMLSCAQEIHAGKAASKLQNSLSKVAAATSCSKHSSTLNLRLEGSLEYTVQRSSPHYIQSYA